jgi:hypothetical protein
MLGLQRLEVQAGLGHEPGDESGTVLHPFEPGLGQGSELVDGPATIGISHTSGITDAPSPLGKQTDDVTLTLKAL